MLCLSVTPIAPYHHYLPPILSDIGVKKMSAALLEMIIKEFMFWEIKNIHNFYFFEMNN